MEFWENVKGVFCELHKRLEKFKFNLYFSVFLQ